jgi:hypothetical protein
VAENRPLDSRIAALAWAAVLWKIFERFTGQGCRGCAAGAADHTGETQTPEQEAELLGAILARRRP